MAIEKITKSVITQFHNVDPKSYKQEIINELREVLVNELKNIKPQPQKEYLSREEVAKMLKVSETTLHNWSKDGILNPYKIGNRVLYKKHEIDTALIKVYHHDTENGSVSTRNTTGDE